MPEALIWLQSKAIMPDEPYTRWVGPQHRRGLGTHGVKGKRNAPEYCERKLTGKDKFEQICAMLQTNTDRVFTEQQEQCRMPPKQKHRKRSI
jgi:hypothetical protein